MSRDAFVHSVDVEGVRYDVLPKPGIEKLLAKVAINVWKVVVA